MLAQCVCVYEHPLALVATVPCLAGAFRRRWLGFLILFLRFGFLVCNFAVRVGPLNQSVNDFVVQV